MAAETPPDPFAREDDDLDRQFTAAAREAYLAAADAFVAEVRRHVAETAAREGRQREWPAHVASSDRLREAADAWSEAQLDWCGSAVFPPLALDDEDEEGDELDDGEEEVAECIVSVLTRHDYEVTDTAALVEAGRAAYLRTWPDDVRDDAEVRVTDARDAVAELIHEAGWELFEAPGIEALSTHQRIVETAEVADLSVEAAEALGEVRWPDDD